MTDATTVDTEALVASGHTATRAPLAETGPDCSFGRGRLLFNASAAKLAWLRLSSRSPRRTVLLFRMAHSHGQNLRESTDDLISVQPNLSRLFGQGSVFALDGKEHRARRKLLAPPFHGQSIGTTRRSSRRRRCARRPHGRGARVRHARTDEPDHAERDPADRIRRGRNRTGLSPRAHPAVGQAGFADGHPAGAAVQHGPYSPWGRLTNSAATSTARCSS